MTEEFRVARAIRAPLQMLAYAGGMVTLALALLLSTGHPSMAAVSMTTSATELIFSTPAYEARFSKTNGAITAISDPKAGRTLSTGNRNGVLWGLTFSDNQYFGAGNLIGGGGRFAYTWNAAGGALTLTYTAASGATRPVDATVTVQFSDTSFTTALALQNRSASVVANVYFPGDVLINPDDVDAGYLPDVLPGTKVAKAFFTQKTPFILAYPTYTVFADYLALDLAGSHLAVFGINPDPKPIIPTSEGFQNYTAAPAGYAIYHAETANTAALGTWQSQTFRFVVGQDTAASVALYRSDNQIDQYPSLTSKLSSLGLSALPGAPLVKLDQKWLNQKFSATSAALATMPGPLLLHPVGFNNGGYEANYPDYLPTDAAYGTTADFTAMIASAKAAGNFVMPYINPMWWSFSSPTLSNLPTGVSADSLWARDAAGKIKTLSDSSATGYQASPTVPYVQQRLDALMAQLTGDLGVNCVFEDQIGAVGWVADTNTTATGPGSFADGWLAHQAKHAASRCLMTEMGFDRAAKSNIGFHGSPYVAYAKNILNSGYGIATVPGFGAGNWSSFPLAQMMFGDKVMFYHHNLDPLPVDKTVVAYNMAFGLVASVNNWNAATAAQFIQPAAVKTLLTWLVPLQQRVGARLTGKTIQSFSTAASGVTTTSFGDITVTGNSAGAAAVASGTSTIAAGGFEAKASDGSLQAGIYAGAFNAGTLAAGDHTIIVDNLGTEVQLRHSGADGPIAVPLPAGWAGAALEIAALDAGGAVLQTAAGTATAAGVTVQAAAAQGAAAVAYYRIRNSQPAPLSGAVFSTAQSGSQSFLRFFNTGSTAGTVMATLRSTSTGQILGQWTSPSIASGAEVQYDIRTVETGAGVTGTKPDYYALALQSGISGSFQHVLFRPTDGTLTNLSTCGGGVTADPAKLSGVHSSILSALGFPSSVVVTNTGAAAATVTLGVYDARDGSRLGAYTTTAIPANGEAVLMVSAIEAGMGKAPTPGMYHYVIRIESPFTGFLQHLVNNQGAGVITDMTTGCALSGTAAATGASPLRGGSIFSTAQSASQSFLRLNNTGATAGTVAATLHDYATGQMLGKWTSPSIPAGAELQYDIATVERGAGITGAKPGYYTLSLQSGIAGYFQHVLFRPTDGTLTNLSTCAAGVTANAAQLSGVHSSILGALRFPSTVVVTNLGAGTATVMLGVYDARDGTKLGTYTAAAIPAGGEAVLSVSTIEAGIALTPSSGMYHYVVKVESPFTGFLQHLVNNQGAGVITDMTTECALAAP